jgi:hypothetical protein
VVPPPRNLRQRQRGSLALRFATLQPSEGKLNVLNDDEETALLTSLGSLLMQSNQFEEAIVDLYWSSAETISSRSSIEFVSSSWATW